MKSADAVAVARKATKKTSRWKAVVFANPLVNGTVIMNANSTCTPGRATRSSLRSSISSRFERSLRVSSATQGGP
jgi:hypothetical protein